MKLLVYLIIGAVIIAIFLLRRKSTPSAVPEMPTLTSTAASSPLQGLPGQPLSYFQTSPTTAKIPILPQHQTIYYYDETHPPEFLLPPGQTYPKPAWAPWF